MFREAMAAIDNRERARARDLLTRLLKINPHQPEYWLWLSAVVDSPKERAYCLKETLRLDPQNESARRGLVMLGELPPDPSLAVPARLQQSDWQAALKRDTQPLAPLKRNWKTLALYGTALAAVIALIALAAAGISNARRAAAQRYRPDSYEPIAAVTATASVTPTHTPLPPGPTPPWAVLAAPYTPTPLYASTPHPRSEAYGLALRAIERADWDTALQYLQQVAQGEPGVADVAYRIGEVNRFKADHPAALAAFEQAISFDPNFAPGYLGRARARRALEPDAVDACLADLERAAALDPNLGEAFVDWADLLIGQAQPEAALERLDQAQSSLAGSPLLPYHRARAYLALGDLAQAEAQIWTALQADLTRMPAYRLHAQILRAAGRLADSLVPLEILRLHGDSPADAETLAWLGDAYAASGRTEDALVVYGESLALDAEQAGVYAARGQLYLARGDAAGALADFTQALRLEPRSFAAQIGKARAELAAGNDRQAVQTLNRAETAAGSDRERAELYYWRAQALTASSPAKAVQEWERLLAVPAESLPAEYRQTAEAQIAALATPTPPPAED
ncbi:MAG TPA: tetratricopeptide repeat protein [Anaerolineaceae bacterium]|nr:tetratricopeptide repeat protein [Anaerolineaceae bacterium]